MVKRRFIPDEGDLVWLSFSPQAGREQAGRRPALVLSSRGYNQISGLCLVCPITSKSKGYPFEVELPDAGPVQGVILSDHVRSADWTARQVEPIGRTSNEIMEEVRERLKPLIGM